MHGVKGIRGEPGHKGDRGPMGLPVSTTVQWGTRPPAQTLAVVSFLCDFLDFESVFVVAVGVPGLFGGEGRGEGEGGLQNMKMYKVSFMFI